MYRIDWKPFIKLVMAVLLIVGLYVLLFPSLSLGQELSVTAEDAGYHYVIGRGDTLSQHTTERKAIEQAMQWSVNYPNETVYVVRDYRLRVRADNNLDIYDTFWTTAVESTDNMTVGLSFKTTADTAWVTGRCISGTQGTFPFKRGVQVTDGQAQIQESLPYVCPELIVLHINAPVSGDTVTVNEYIDMNEKVAGMDLPTIGVSDTVYVNQADTVYLYEPDEPIYVNAEPNFNDEIALTNGIYWQFKTDSTQGVQLKLFGKTEAERIGVGIKCVGVDSQGMFTDQRTGFSMIPDSNNVVQGSSNWLDDTCNQFMTYWLTAYTAQDTVRVSRFVDVGEDWSGREQF